MFIRLPLQRQLQTTPPVSYVYLRDQETGEYWSASWAPVCKPLDEFKSECRHGTAYTIITSEYKGVKSEVTYYVPQGATYEVWAAKVTNTSDKPRKLAVTGYCEFVNDPNYEQDQVNLQYTLFITRTYFKGNYIHQMQNEIYNPNSGRFLGLAAAKVDAYCGDRDSFVGSYRSYANPKGIEEGLKGDLNCQHQLLRRARERHRPPARRIQGADLRPRRSENRGGDHRDHRKVREERHR